MKHFTAQSVARSSVYADWTAWLPDTKSRMFVFYARELETAFARLSLSLDEAIALHNRGEVTKSCEVVSFSAPLCARLTISLQGILRSLQQCVKVHGLVPNVVPLSRTDFLGLRGKYHAQKSALLSSVSRSQRSVFAAKIKALEDLIDKLGDDYSTVAKELLSDVRVDRSELWVLLDEDHFDLNTCMREILVLLKCVLRVLPDNGLMELERSISLYVGKPGMGSGNGAGFLSK